MNKINDNQNEYDNNDKYLNELYKHFCNDLN